MIKFVFYLFDFLQFGLIEEKEWQKSYGKIIKLFVIVKIIHIIIDKKEVFV